MFLNCNIKLTYPHCRSRFLWPVSQPALGWLKGRYDAEHLEASIRGKHLSLSLPYKAICWWLVKGGGGNYLSFLSEFMGHALGFWFWISSCEEYFGFGRPASVEDQSLDSPVGQQTPWVYTDEKLFRLGDFKFSFGCCNPAYRAPVLRAFLRCIVQADAGSRRAGRGWRLPVNFELVCLVMLSQYMFWL